MAVIGMDMIAEAGMLMQASRTSQIQRTQQRDQEHIAQLEADGWKVIVLWECELKLNFELYMQQLINAIHGHNEDSKNEVPL